MKARLAGEHGGFAVQVLVVLLVFCLVGYEAIAVGLSAIGVDDASRQVARAARDAYRSSDGSLDAATEVAEAAAPTHRAQVVDVSTNGEVLTVTLSRQASTLLLHRMAATDDWTVRTATGRAPLGVT